MAYSSSSGAKLYIATGSGANSSPADLTAYEALTWTQVNGVETLGEFGDKASMISFSVLGDSRVRKQKGAYDAGDLTVTLIRDGLDTGQTALRTAAAASFMYNFKITLDDAADSNDDNSAFYFGGYVMGTPTNIGGNNDMTKQSVQIAINTAITLDNTAVVS